MGTTYHVVVPELPASTTANDVKRQIEDRLHDLNQNLSTWIPDSMLTRFNESRSTSWVELPKELVQLVAAAETISQLTHGAYDVTVGPVVDLWGFGAHNPTIDSIPDNASIRKALERVGYEKLMTRDKPAALKKSRADLEIDLSSIAKGYAVDQIGLVLEAHDIQNYLVEIGGEVRTRGLSPRKDSWRVGIESPDSTEPQAEVALGLTNAHLATSGDYRNYFEKDGIRYSHTVDARNGKTIKHKLASVTVMHESTMLADAWATALMVLGEEAGFDLAKKLSISAYFIYRASGGFQTRHTGAFYTAMEP